MALSGWAPRRAVTAAAVALSAMLLAGCAVEPEAAPATTSAATPSSSPGTPAPTRTPADPLAAVDTLRLNAETIDLLADSHEVRSLPLTDASGTLAALTRVLGAPAVKVTTADPQHVCTLPSTRYSWNEELVLVKWTSGEPAGYEVRLLGGPLEGNSGRAGVSGAVALTATGGVKVGDDISAVIARTPPELQDSWSLDGVTHHTVILQQGYRDRADTTGVAAFTDEGVVTAIGTPVPVHSDQDC